MNGLKGIIALDIDGTITHDPRLLHGNVESYFQYLMNSGWKFIFLTGRTFAFSYPIVSSFTLPYFLACQNGAHLFEMPSRKTLIKNYLDSSHLSYLETTFQKQKLPLVIESGYAHGDLTYYHPQDFATPELSQYLDLRISLSSDRWVAADLFQNISINDFATGKYFSKEKEVLKLPFHTLTLRDPFRPGYVLTHINHEQARKGAILETLCQKFPGLPVIAAGDDHNDFEMLLRGDVKIVSDHAPQALKDIADIIAPCGIGMINAIEEAFAKL